MSSKQILGDIGIQQALDNLAEQIAKSNPPSEQTILVGIITRGATLANRLKKILSKKYNLQLVTASLDTRPFRDDLQEEIKENRSEMPEAIDGKNIIIVDDVVSTGRTIRAALDALMDCGRPKNIKTAILIDLDHRELPITSNYIGIKLHTSVREKIKVRLKEVDKGKDRAYITLK
ncbi:MAG: bifunctional pyr operon transcriptional regulator/uracil phosphoribosyltransferase PyrR [Candidatus Altiarchaeota archaeon]|nr:bifunctional pyr operon transcriptional regulator/uracil phosphoribosyltransferase PyrR [Candidatus Altiarchaeota archaeon]